MIYWSEYFSHYNIQLHHTDPLSDSFEIGNKKKCKQTIKYENKNIEITEQESPDISFNQFVVKYLEIDIYSKYGGQT